MHVMRVHVNKLLGSSALHSSHVRKRVEGLSSIERREKNDEMEKSKDAQDEVMHHIV